MKRLLSLLVVLVLSVSFLPCRADGGITSQGSASAHVYTFEELTGLSGEDITRINIRSGADGVEYSTTLEEVISEIYSAINTKTFNVYMGETDGWSYEITFIDKNNSEYTYTIPNGITVKAKDGLTYRTTDENLKKVVERSYKIIADIDTEEVSTFEELTKISTQRIEKISIGCSKSGLGVSEFSVSSPLVISQLVNSFKDMKFKKEVRSEGGGAGGWLYAMNFYMEDGTYIQLGSRIHIDKITYNAVDSYTVIEKMAHYYDLMKNIDSSKWAYDYILECYELGFLEGITNISYKEPVTREKFCEIIYNMLDKTMKPEWKKVSPNPFKDTVNEKIFSLYLEGIIKGKADGEFKPDDYLTREEAATIIDRIYKNGVLTGTGTTGVWLKFDDESEISDWALSGVQNACKQGIMLGVDANKFAPKDIYTTEQAITSIVRMYHQNFKGVN
ncbi:MAG: S-layer homology domain-containing protein [Ruminococcaceae bacterium]|nr:S-layer homology domain-containing protein [Oscillospiraceae bacterium]